MGSLRVPALPLLLLSLLLPLVTTTSADARKKDSYEDTRKRFRLKLPAGWRLTPMPGDTRGMAFRKDADDAFALFSIQVREVRAGETVSQAIERATLPFAAEIGFRQGADVPTTVGAVPGTRRTLSAFVSGDSRMVRAVELTTVVAFGFVHTLHFEALQEHKGRFARDLDRMLASYEALAGRRIYAPLVGRWDADDGGPSLFMGEDQQFTLGPLAGMYSADGGRLLLMLTEGRESYRYLLRGRQLVLRSPNLEEPQVYSRSGAPAFRVEGSKPNAARGKLTRDMLVGRWRVVDNGGSDPGTMVLAPSGAIAFGGLSGRWRYKRGLLTITSAAGETVTYHVSHDGSGLILGGGDFDREVHLRPD